jgi:Zn-dependent oligopeptidase
MKKSQLKELIKESMTELNNPENLEQMKNTGAMTSTEEEMVSNYENPLEEGDSDDVRSRVAALEEARDMLGQVVEIISYALKGTTHQRHAEAYILPHLNNWIDDSGYNIGIQQYIDALIGGDDDEESLDEVISRVDSIVESYNKK